MTAQGLECIHNKNAFHQQHKGYLHVNINKNHGGGCTIQRTRMLG